MIPDSSHQVCRIGMYPVVTSSAQAEYHQKTLDENHKTIQDGFVILDIYRSS